MLLIIGALFRPDGYTLEGVEAVYGSSENGNCPVQCVGMVNSIRRCFCGIGNENIINGALIDGIVPLIIDTTLRDAPGINFVWASQLYTARRNTGSAGVGNVTISFRFFNRFTLREVELYMFNCPTMGIGTQSAHVNDAGGGFLISRQFAMDLGSVTTTDMLTCTSLTRVSIQIQTPSHARYYAIDFTTPYEWVHIGEVRFSDQLITTTSAPTTTVAPNTTNPTTLTPTTDVPTTDPLPQQPLTSGYKIMILFKFELLCTDKSTSSPTTVQETGKDVDEGKDRCYMLLSVSK